MRASVHKATSDTESQRSQPVQAPGKSPRTGSLAGARAVQRKPAEPEQAEAEESAPATKDESSVAGLEGELTIGWALVHEDAEEVGGAAADEATATAAAAAAPVQLKPSRRDKAAKKISTPIPAGAKIRRNLSAVVSIANPSGATTVIIKPDTRNKSVGANKARTRIGFSLSAGKYMASNADNTIMTFRPFTVKWSIQTAYGPGASASTTSGYGRGTTSTDKKAKHTTLKFHEGSHGTDYLTYLRSNPMPVFGGKVGDDESVWLAAHTTYKAALKTYLAAMEAHSVGDTDCVGTSAGFCPKP